jgi:hypothetical protein
VSQNYYFVLAWVYYLLFEKAKHLLAGAGKSYLTHGTNTLYI